MGMRTPHWKSTSLEASLGVSAANAAAARESRRANSGTAERRACAGTGISLDSIVREDCRAAFRFSRCGPGEGAQEVERDPGGISLTETSPLSPLPSPSHRPGEGDSVEAVLPVGCVFSPLPI